MLAPGATMSRYQNVACDADHSFNRAALVSPTIMQVSPGTQQAERSAQSLHHTSSTATEAFVMNDRAEQRFRQLEIKVNCTSTVLQTHRALI